MPKTQTGGAGNWFDVSNWDNGLPSLATDAQIDNGNPINSDVLFNGTGPIGNLTIDAGDTLRIQNARVMSVEDGNNLFTNNGLIQFEGTGSTRILVDRSGVSAVDLTFDGSGTVRLTNSSHSITSIGEPTLVNGINHTIEGEGRVGTANMTFMNQGLLHGNVNGGTLTIESNDSFTNAGVVRASGGGQVNAFAQTSVGGIYEAIDPGSEVHFTSGSVSDAILDGRNGGLIRVDDEIQLHNISNLGRIQAQTTHLSGSLTNSGTIQYLNGFQDHMTLQNDLQINGGGTIEFAQGGSAANGGFKLFNNDNQFTGFGLFETETQFAELSSIAPGLSSDATASFDSNAPLTFAGTMTLDLGGTDVNDAAAIVNQVNSHTHPSMDALDFDQLNIFGSAGFVNNSLLDIDLVNGFIPDPGDFFDLLTADNLQFINNLDFDLPVINGMTFDHQVLTLFDSSAGFDRDVLRFTFGAAAVPEPSSFTLIGILGVAFVLVRRRSRIRSQQSREPGNANRRLQGKNKSPVAHSEWCKVFPCAGRRLQNSQIRAETHLFFASLEIRPFCRN